jgi:hypothetical protein
MGLASKPSVALAVGATVLTDTARVVSRRPHDQCGAVMGRAQRIRREDHVVGLPRQWNEVERELTGGGTQRQQPWTVVTSATWKIVSTLRGATIPRRREAASLADPATVGVLADVRLRPVGCHKSGLGR